MIYQQKFYTLPDSIQKLIELTIELAKPQKVFLFGSRARGDHRDNSDFDIAISQRAGSNQDWTTLLLRLSEEPITLFKVDLVEVESLNEKYKVNIRKEGVLLYEKTN